MNDLTLKDILIQELNDISDSLIVEVIDFVQFLKAKQEQEQEDLEDARTALRTVTTEGTVSWEDLKKEVGL